jgi:hypothetical protein
MANFQAVHRLSLHISFHVDTLSCFLSDDAAALANVMLTRDLAQWLLKSSMLVDLGMRAVAGRLHRPRLPPCLGGGVSIDTRLWAPALAVGMEFSFSLFRI